MSTAAKPHYTEAEYLARERRAKHKSEYYRGVVLPLPPTTDEHDRIVLNVAGRLHDQRKNKDCKVYPSGIRLRTPSGLYSYADVTIACGEFDFVDDHSDTILTPKVIVEVLSESTIAYDLGTKFQHYRSFESLAHYVAIASDRAHIELYTRRPDRQWVLADVDGLDAKFDLPAIACSLSLAVVYEGLTLTRQPLDPCHDAAAATT